MPRKDFLRDIAEAAVPGRFSRIVNIRAGECDDSISFTLTAPDLNLALEFQAIVSGCHGYPKSHSFLVFSTSEGCPPEVTTALENGVPLFAGSTVHKLLTNIEDLITHSATDPPVSNHSDKPEDDFDDDESMVDDGEFGWESDNEDNLPPPVHQQIGLKEMIRRDLRVVKEAGFKVGYWGSDIGMIIVSVSCRISKLGISKEAMSAWGVEPTEYLVLLIRYAPHYADLQTVLEANDLKNTLLHMHVGLCDSYKPSFHSAIERLLESRTRTLSETATSDNTMCGQIMKPLFIGRSLDSLLNEQLLGIIKLRIQNAFSWTMAEHFFQTTQGMISSASDATSEVYRRRDRATPTSAFLAVDHVAELDRDPSRMSLPLVAMQFTLRHFTKCTEFCLVCHCKTGDTFEALKPYVCSNELCLYQYMALGMGPNIEYEINSQPSVVDLLISLAYARASSGLLQDFPTGLRLRVPAKLLDQTTDGKPAEHPGALLYKEGLLLNSIRLPSSVRTGDWIVFARADHGRDWHCRVTQILGPQKWLISHPISRGKPVASEALDGPLRGPKLVNFVVYDTNMDDLDIAQKQRMLSILLSELPTLEDMTTFVRSHAGLKALSSWEDMISPAGVNIIRWILASNRSLIRRDDNEPQHQVSGMDDYIQFQLVQAAADKEQRFLNAVNSILESQDPAPDHPTLFAWHGSPVSNWHSILREGLHFNFVANGRAHGNGIYMSNYFRASLMYTGPTSDSSIKWPESRMKLVTVVALNEIVNAPNQFVSCSPYYVVQHLDWIQPRYLFVQIEEAKKPEAALPTDTVAAAEPRQNVQADSMSQASNSGGDNIIYYQQDKRFPVIGPDEQPIQIPISVFSANRRDYLRTVAQKDAGGTESEEDGTDDDNYSVMTAVSDLELLFSDDEKAPEAPGTPMQREDVPDHDYSKTDSQPGTMEAKSLPVPAPPKYATSTATMALQHHLNATIKTQNKVPPHELGWSVDLNAITSVYQWIVEMHSFDPDLPLAKDLEAANMKSIVLEVRFPPQFPNDPPLVRVMRPRFLPFAAGGGGHVVAGGAMCMELLTHSGWLPTVSIESVLLQVRMALTSTEPRPARLDFRTGLKTYTVHEAVESYRRVAAAHGWKISEDTEELIW
ncbi:Ubiquitin-conjugating enzyme E2 [Penicillium sp. DV-2018c]|nr:Ubiquitin-conjugating enzyme E2 [Penicillium sp. DV-2018c]KAJ5566356.1 Ubiquitin-conjugating enzyme E2 [Penicillium sp. DV-2018c]